jgi:ABC-type transport system substrate-binding protein
MTDPIIGKNKPLRQAMSMAFDRDTFIKVYLNGRGAAGTGAFPPDAPLFDPKYCGKWNHFDLAQAKAKLAEAEKINGGPFPKLHIIMTDVDTTERQYGEYFKSQMARIGLVVEPECVTYDRFLERQDQKNFQMIWTGWAPDYPDERTYLALYDARLVKPPGSNTTGYVNAHFQDLFVKSESMLRSPQRDALYLQMRDIIDDDLPTFAIYYRLIYSLRFDWVGNVKDPLFNNMYNAHRTLDVNARRKALRGN